MNSKPSPLTHECRLNHLHAMGESRCVSHCGREIISWRVHPKFDGRTQAPEVDCVVCVYCRYEVAAT